MRAHGSQQKIPGGEDNVPKIKNEKAVNRIFLSTSYTRKEQKLLAKIYTWYLVDVYLYSSPKNTHGVSSAVL